MTARATLTPALVRAGVRAGNVYRVLGTRRWVRVQRVTVDPPSVLVRGITRRGARVRGPRSEPWTVYLTWDPLRRIWRMPSGYDEALLLPTVPQ